MIDMTDLQREIPDTLIDTFYGHLENVINHYGTDALLQYIDHTRDAKIQGRLFYRIDTVENGTPQVVTMSLDPKAFNEAFAKKLDHLTSNGSDFTAYFDAFAKRLEQHPDFKQLFTDLLAKHPEQGQELTRFLAAQAAFVALENSVRKRVENTSAVQEYTTLDKSLRSNKDKIKILDKASDKESKKAKKTLQKVNSEMEKRMPALTQRYQEAGTNTNRILINARRAIETYVKAPPAPGDDLRAKL